MNILLTGATGFLGSHLLRRLVAEGHFVVITKRSTSNIWRIEDVIPNVKPYNVDKDDLENIFLENQIDIVIHSATNYIKREFTSDISELIESNISFPLQLLNLMSKYNCNYFINTGTFFEYLPKKNLTSENSLLSPFNYYAETKILFFNLLRYYGGKGMKIIDLKLFSPFGPDDKENRLILHIIKNLILKNKIHLTKGEQKLNWTYYKDIIEAYLLAIYHIKEMDSNFEVFNIGSSEVLSIREIGTYLSNLADSPSLILYDKDYSDNEIFYSQANISKAQTLLKWKPQYTIKEGLEETFHYYFNKNGIN